jgi:hypothetical protein
MLCAVGSVRQSVTGHGADAPSCSGPEKNAEETENIQHLDEGQGEEEGGNGGPPRAPPNWRGVARQTSGNPASPAKAGRRRAPRTTWRAFFWSGRSVLSTYHAPPPTLEK